VNRFSKIIVALVILLNVAFTGAVLYLCLRNATVPDSIIIAWFGFTTGELWMLSSITKTKVKQPGDYESGR
jgi:Na+-transporting NADH:ubiquinone oxidoreductase subunit NqrE